MDWDKDRAAAMPEAEQQPFYAQSYSPFAYKPPSRAPPAPVEIPASLKNKRTKLGEKKAAGQATLLLTYGGFRVAPSESLLAEARCSLLDYRSGVCVVRVFVMSSYFIACLERSNPARPHVVLPLGSILSWSDAEKEHTPGAPPFVKVRVSRQFSNEHSSSLIIFASDKRLHMLFDFTSSLEKFRYILDSAWRAYRTRSGSPLIPPAPLQAPAIPPAPPHNPPAPPVGAQLFPHASQPLQRGASAASFTLGRGNTSPSQQMWGQSSKTLEGLLATPLPAAPEGPEVDVDDYGVELPVPSNALTPVAASPIGVGMGAVPQQSPRISPRGGASPPASPPGQVPQIPQVQHVPQIPQMSQMPHMPQIPQIQPIPHFIHQVSQTPKMAQITQNVSQFGISPLLVNPMRLTFGAIKNELPVMAEVSENVVIQNTLSDASLAFCFEASRYHKCDVWADPRAGTLLPGQSTTIRVALFAHCTTSSLRPKVAVVSWCGDAQQQTMQFPPVQFDISLATKLTSRLDYEELEQDKVAIGDGSFATVYRATFRGLTVAVKTLKRQEELTDTTIQAFVSEVAMMEKLRHACIVQFIGAVHLPGFLSIVTEFCEYGSLNDCLRKGKLSWPLKLKCLHDAARGIDFLHRSNILHRDLKPDNLLIVSLEVGAPIVAKISDFGTTRDVNLFAEELRCTRGIGTPIFMAPEVLQGMQYEKPADVYSFALMMHNVAGNRLPYTDDPDIKQAWQFAQLVINGKRPHILPEWPEFYVALMQQGWTHNPRDRPTFPDIVRAIEEMMRVEHFCDL